ncbi:hypothetical protein [Kribbella antibiotica]|nr:hypothetical protein [Kribbella antibiotica]
MPRIWAGFHRLFRRGTRRIVGRYFDEGPFTSPTRLAILPRVAYHRMLSTYLNTFAAAGLPITQMAEPVGDRPVWQSVPGILHFRCQRSSQAARPLVEARSVAGGSPQG